MSKIFTGLLVIFLSCCSMGQSKTEKELMRVGIELDHGVMAIMDWGEDFPKTMGGVIGSAFLINDEGYFITAAHVLQTYQPKGPRVVAMMRDMHNNGSGNWFDVIDKDEKRDIALCKMLTYNPALMERSQKLAAKQNVPVQMMIPWSLPLAKSIPPVGSFVVIGGFPMGSWNPSVQMGHIATERTISPLIGVSDLFQISVAGNQGDSGGPVVDLHTGQVLGVIVRSSFTQVGASLQSSGILMAAPITWVDELLAKNHISGVTNRHR